MLLCSKSQNLPSNRVSRCKKSTLLSLPFCFSSLIDIELCFHRTFLLLFLHSIMRFWQMLRLTERKVGYGPIALQKHILLPSNRISVPRTEEVQTGTENVTALCLLKKKYSKTDLGHHCRVHQKHLLKVFLLSSFLLLALAFVLFLCGAGSLDLSC